MVVTNATTADDMEQLKALTSNGSLKDLLNKEVVLQEVMILTPEEGEQDARTTVALKVEGRYYKGISQKVIDTATHILAWHAHKGGQGEVDVKVKLEKSAGKYGNYELYLV